MKFSIDRFGTGPRWLHWPVPVHADVGPGEWAFQAELRVGQVDVLG